jgi:hypothetical protein
MCPSDDRSVKKEVRDLLISAGETLDPERNAQIQELAMACIEVLLEVLSDPTLRAPQSPGSGFAPVHAANVLGELAPEVAVGPLLDTLATTSPIDPLFMAVIDALEPQGPRLVNPVLERLPTAIGEYRRELWSLLAKSGVRAPRVFDALLTALAEDPEAGAMSLAEYGDPAALPHLSAAFDRYQIRPGDHLDPDDSIAFELQEAIEALDGKMTPDQEAKYERAVWARRVQMESQDPQRPDRSPRPSDLCPCGSGRLYRHCCLH